jgi:hypothetical protein
VFLSFGKNTKIKACDGKLVYRLNRTGRDVPDTASTDLRATPGNYACDPALSINPVSAFNAFDFFQSTRFSA